MNSRTITIGNRAVGDGQPMYLIAEVGLGHDGSLGMAHSYIDAAADCGVDAVKFQTHIATEESSKYENFRVKVFPQDDTRFDYWTRTAFTKKQLQELAAHCRDRDVHFLSSPFSEAAVDWLIDCDVPAWKVASGEVSNLPMLKRMAATGKPILVSSGMSSWDELAEAAQYIESMDAPLAVFQCTTSYPCPPETWGLNVITEMRSRLKCPVGLSDHSGTIFPALAARMLHASMLEFHITYHKKQFGPDVKASLTVEQTEQLVQGIRSIESALASPVDKDAQAAELSELRTLFSKSLYAANDLSVGHRLTESDIEIRKPQLGIPASKIQDCIGKRIQKPVAHGEPITIDSLGD